MSIDVLKLALRHKDLALADANGADARSAQVVPGDFGEHEPIPEEAVMAMNVGHDQTTGRRLKALYSAEPNWAWAEMMAEFLREKEGSNE